MSVLSHLIIELKSLQDKEKQQACARYFKTGDGEYGEGDIFWGVAVPKQRLVAKKYRDLPLPDIQKLLENAVHECRMTGLFILVYQSQKAFPDQRKKIVDLYLRNTRRINNWDLVDCSAPTILGGYLLDKDRDLLYKLAKSDRLWEKRIAVLATFAFIRNYDFKDALEIAHILLGDQHDLLHKAVGWMLREIGNRDLAVEEAFLKKNYKNMPRTMLRYAVEKFENKKRESYLKGKI